MICMFRSEPVNNYSSFLGLKTQLLTSYTFFQPLRLTNYVALSPVIENKD